MKNEEKIYKAIKDVVLDDYEQDIEITIYEEKTMNCYKIYIEKYFLVDITKLIHKLKSLNFKAIDIVAYKNRIVVYTYYELNTDFVLAP